MDYNFDVKYKSGKTMYLPDFLSRFPKDRIFDESKHLQVLNIIAILLNYLQENIDLHIPKGDWLRQEAEIDWLEFQMADTNLL